MKTSLLALAALLSVAAAPGPGDGDTYQVFRCNVTLPVVHETLNAKGEQVLATLTLKSADILNLALGRPLGTQPDKATEVLAFASNSTTPGAGSVLVVFNPQTDQVVTTVFATSGFVLLHDEDFSKNVAFAQADIQATSLGTPAENGFLASTLSTGGNGKSAGSFAASSLAGPVHLRFTQAGETTEIEGLVLKGRLKASGPTLAVLFGL